MDRVPVNALPLQRHEPRHAAEDVRRKMLNLDEGQNQEAGIVGQKRMFLRRASADQPMNRSRGPRCRGRRRPPQTGNRPVLGVDDKLQVFADRLRVPEVMVPVKQTVEELLFDRAPHLLELERPDPARASIRAVSDLPVRRPACFRSALRRASGFGFTHRTGGSSICPAR